MSVLELDISTSPEAVFRANGGGSGAFWFDGPADGGATFMGFPCTAQLALRADGVVEIRDAHGAREERSDALAAIERFVAEAPPVASIDAPHTVGFFAYDLVGLLEPHVRPRRDASAVLPLAWLARHDAVIEIPRAGDARRVRAARRGCSRRPARSVTCARCVARSSTSRRATSTR